MKGGVTAAGVPFWCDESKCRAPLPNAAFTTRKRYIVRAAANPFAADCRASRTREPRPGVAAPSVLSELGGQVEHRLADPRLLELVAADEGQGGDDADARRRSRRRGTRRRIRRPAPGHRRSGRRRRRRSARSRWSRGRDAERTADLLRGVDQPGGQPGLGGLHARESRDRDRHEREPDADPDEQEARQQVGRRSCRRPRPA